MSAASRACRTGDTESGKKHAEDEQYCAANDVLKTLTTNSGHGMLKYAQKKWKKNRRQLENFREAGGKEPSAEESMESLDMN